MSVRGRVRAFFSRHFGGGPEKGLPSHDDGSQPDGVGDDTGTQDDLAQQLALAKQAFLDANDSYATTGVGLEQDVIKQLAPYHDSAYDRAPIIRAFARDLSEQIQTFYRTRAREVSQVAMLTMNFTLTTNTLGIAAVSGAMDEMNAATRALLAKVTAMYEPSQPPGETRVPEADASAQAEQRRARLEDAFQRVGEEMIWAYGIATSVVELRQGELDAYLQKVPLADRTSEVRKALAIAITKQAALQAVGFAPGGPIVTALVGIADARNEVREKVEAMTAHYRRGPLDEMFELAQAIDDERQIHSAVEQMLDQVYTFLSRVQEEHSPGKGLGTPEGH